MLPQKSFGNPNWCEMAQTRRNMSRLFVLAGVFFATLSQSGCAKSPSELLIGRWYSGEMTIRFREDSAVIWNSPEGLALGRYEFEGNGKRLKDTERVPNLFVDVIRNDERQKFQFEVSFLGQDRIRMELIPIGKEISGVEAARGQVLRRANDNTLGGGPAKVASR